MEIKETVLGGEVVNGGETVQVCRGQIIKDICVFSWKKFLNEIKTTCFFILKHVSVHILRLRTIPFSYTSKVIKNRKFDINVIGHFFSFYQLSLKFPEYQLIVSCPGSYPGS